MGTYDNVAVTIKLHDLDGLKSSANAAELYRKSYDKLAQLRTFLELKLEALSTRDDTQEPLISINTILEELNRE